MKVMITGGAGYIGSHLAYKLLEKNGVEQIVLYDTLQRKNMNAFKINHLSDYEKIKIVNNDVNDYWALRNALDYFSPTHIVHLSGLVNADQSILYPETYFKENTVAVENLMEAIFRQQSVVNLVFSSSAAVYGDIDKPAEEYRTPLRPVNPYGTSKKIAEKLIEGSNISGKYTERNFQYTILRLFNVAGFYPYITDSSKVIHEKSVIPKMIKAVKEHKPFFIRDKSCVRDYVGIDDVCNVMVNSLKHRIGDYNRHDIFNVCTGIGTSLETLIKEFESGTGCSLITKNSKQGNDGLILTSTGSPDRLKQHGNYSCKTNICDIMTGIKSNLFSE